MANQGMCRNARTLAADHFNNQPEIGKGVRFSTIISRMSPYWGVSWFANCLPVEGDWQSLVPGPDGLFNPELTHSVVPGSPVKS
jgi:hypothetical protein